MEKKQYEMVIKPVANQHPCYSGDKIGDEWLFNYFTPPHMYGLAFNAIYHVALALQYGTTFPGRKTLTSLPPPARMPGSIMFSS